MQEPSQIKSVVRDVTIQPDYVHSATWTGYYGGLMYWDGEKLVFARNY